MTLYYAKSTNGFYDDAVCQPPSDAVEITKEQHQALMTAQEGGQNIQADSNGNPEAVNPPPASLAFTAQAALAKSDITVVRCYSAGVAVPTANQTYRAALRAIVNGSDTTSTQLPTEPAMPTGI